VNALPIQFRVVKRAADGERRVLRDVPGCCEGCPSVALGDPGVVGAPTDVAVIVVCHNDGRFLAEAIHSVLVQTRPPAEILVVDDASSDDTPAVCAQFGPLSDQSGCVRSLRVDVRDVHRARAAGWAATRASLVCFLDADDILPPDDLEAGVPLWDDPAVGIESADVERFGDQTGRVESRVQPGKRIHQENFVHAGSLVHRMAFERSRVFEIACPPLANDDWFLWRRIVPFGWRLATSSAVYRYRKHAASKLAT
jgi:glycosyltransferase involved in cell wall biosynthesis